MPWRTVSVDSHQRTAGKSHSHKALPHAVFLITLAATLAMGWSLYESSTKAHRSSAWVQYTYEVLGTISSVEDQLTRAEAALRAYVVSGNASFLMERDGTLTLLNDDVARLQRLVPDHAQQASRASLLKDLVAKRLAIMTDTVKQYEIGGTSASGSTLRAAQRVSDRIFEVTREMREVEENLLDVRKRDEDRRYDRTMVLLIVATVLAVGLLVPAYIAFIQQSRARAHVERKLFDMADGVPGVVYQYRSRSDGSSHYEFMSSGVDELYGITREAALHDPAVISNAVLDDDKAALSAAIAKAAENLTPLQYEFRVQPRTGAMKWVHASAAPQKQADGSIVWNGHWADITEQKHLEHALQEAKMTADTASRAKSTFLAVMSHEIRTPLNGVLGMLELLSLTELDAEQRNTLNVVRESSKSLQRIIDDILDFSKIEAGKLEISCEPSSVAAVVENTRNIYAGNASSKGLLLTHSVDPRISPALMVDPLRLRQILNNFVSNAIKFTLSGTIEIRAELQERRDTEEVLRFTVSDQGIGMASDVQARLFQPFVQGGAATTRTYGGTGLGLTISRRLADMMGGSIEMQSELGKGTTMILTLPLAVADPKDLPASSPGAAQASPRVAIAPARTAPTVEAAELEGTLVLLVDDHPVNRMVLSRQVKLLGYAAEIATNGVEALEKWQSGRFAIVITDCNMPEMDGYELARRIRKQEAETGSERTPVIACTANALRGEAESCFEAGMDDYLPKPVNLAELQKKLYQWVPLPDAGGATDDKAVETPDQTEDPDAGIFDSAALAQITGDPSAEGEVLADFQLANREDAAALEQAVKREDLEGARHASHRMKGASRMAGLTALAAACERVEAASRTNDLEAVKRSMETLGHELARADDCISRHVRISST